MRLLPVVLLAAACAREWVRDYEGVLPGTDEDEIYATLVVDAETREPLAGATLRLHRERIEPWQTIAPFVAEFRADRHGMVVVPWEQRFRGCHWVYDRPGYAAKDEFDSPPDVVELKRGQDVKGRIVGAPAGVEVGAAAAHARRTGPARSSRRLSRRSGMPRTTRAKPRAVSRARRVSACFSSRARA